MSSKMSSIFIFSLLIDLKSLDQAMKNLRITFYLNAKHHRQGFKDNASLFYRPTIRTVRESGKKDNWLAPPHLGGPLKFSHATFDTVNEIDGTVKYHGDLIGNDLSHE